MDDEHKQEEIDQSEFLDDAKGFFEVNKRKIGKHLKSGDKTILIDFHELAAFSHDIADNLIDKPEETIQLLEVAIEEIEWIPNGYKVRFTSLTQSQDINIRNLRAKHLNKMIGVEGIIRQASEVRPTVTNIKFECPSCGTIISILQVEKEQKQPSRCSCGRKGGFKEIAKDMIDSQIIILEESPDNLEDGGSQPKRLTIFLKEDLTDPSMSKKITPGNKVKVIGVLKEVTLGTNAQKPLIRYDIAIDANSVITLEDDIDDMEITEEEERTIREISKRDDLIEYLGRSVAPSVCGYENIKRALVLQLFGGVSRMRSDGSYCRAQIHGLLVGDPGVAKSVILKYMQAIAHKSRYVSGKSASGVGLTATAVKDEMTKSWVLEAGAMVLANNGSLFIDEFEKMSEEDRSNLHEGMSIGTISVSKATIQATLSAKTSILAAANPKFGRFEVDRPFASQINLAPSLLSRFDFIFVMRDVAEEKMDNMIADKIFSEHGERTEEDILEKDMFKKYIAFSKSLQPKMGEAPVKVLKEYYIGLRKRAKFIDGKKVIPIGARQLEGLIRFSEASAKIRLSRQVTIEDAKQAIDIMETYLKEVGYDEENKTFDIDKISGNGASQRGMVDVVRNTIKKLSETLGKSVPMDKVKSELDGKISSEDIDLTLDKIIRAGDAFRPRRGIIQLM